MFFRTPRFKVQGAVRQLSFVNLLIDSPEFLQMQFRTAAWEVWYPLNEWVLIHNWLRAAV